MTESGPYMTTETRNTYIVQEHGMTAISKSSFGTLLPQLTLQSSVDIILTKQLKSKSLKMLKVVNRRYQD